MTIVQTHRDEARDLVVNRLREEAAWQVGEADYCRSRARRAHTDEVRQQEEHSADVRAAQAELYAWLADIADGVVQLGDSRVEHTDERTVIVLESTPLPLRVVVTSSAYARRLAVVATGATLRRETVEARTEPGGSQ